MAVKNDHFWPQNSCNVRTFEILVVHKCKVHVDDLNLEMHITYCLSPVFLVCQLCFWHFLVNYSTVICLIFFFKGKLRKKNMLWTNKKFVLDFNWEKLTNNCQIIVDWKCQKHNWRTKKIGLLPIYRFKLLGLSQNQNRHVFVCFLSWACPLGLLSNVGPWNEAISEIVITRHSPFEECLLVRSLISSCLSCQYWRSQRSWDVPRCSILMENLLGRF